MAARSAMGFAAGALRQAAGAGARVAAPVPRVAFQQARSMGAREMRFNPSPLRERSPPPPLARARVATAPPALRRRRLRRLPREVPSRAFGSSPPRRRARGRSNDRYDRSRAPSRAPLRARLGFIFIPPLAFAPRVLPSLTPRAPLPLPHPRARVAGGGGPGVTHGGLTVHEPGMGYKAVAHGMGGLCWFWIFYRFYKDGDTLIYGHAPHFEHDDDEHH